MGLLTNPNLLGLIGKSSSDWSIVEACTEVQSHFRDFHEDLTGIRLCGGLGRLRAEVDLEVGGNAIRFNCYNTAWMSQLKEQPGRLQFPVDALPVAERSPHLVVSLFHHPYGWLDSINARTFRHYIEQSSDFVFTGHAT